MSKKSTCCIGLFFTSLMTLSLSATETPSITLPELVVHPFEEVLLSKMLGKDINYTLQPLKRAAFDFQHGKFSCFVGGSIKSMRTYYNMDVIESNSYLNWGVGVYTLRTQKTINNITELENKSAVVLRGNTFLKNLRNKFKLSDVSIVTRDEQAIAMLEAQRVDVAFYWYPVLKEENTIHRDESLSLYQDQSRLVCHPSDANKIFIQTFNRSLQQLKDNGWLEQLKKEHFQ